MVDDIPVQLKSTKGKMNIPVLSWIFGCYNCDIKILLIFNIICTNSSTVLVVHLGTINTAYIASSEFGCRRKNM